MVDPSWEDGAIRLTIRPATGPTLHTHSFRRVDVTSGLGVLSRNMQSTLDLRGDYRSDLREKDEHVVGWLQVRAWEPSAQRVYEAVFPQGFSVVDICAAVVALDSEVEFIRRTLSDANTGALPRLGR